MIFKESTVMMLYPPVADLVDKVGSRYQLVNVVAQRARQIAAESEEAGEPLDEKPVSIAIDEVYAGKLTINTDEETVQAKREAETAAAED
jgi:DNA-directed RNA polymerase subunit omega